MLSGPDAKRLLPSLRAPDRSPMPFAKFNEWATEHLSDAALRELLHCFGVVPSPDQERDAVQAAWAAALPYQENEVVYLVSHKWWARWCEHTGTRTDLWNQSRGGGGGGDGGTADDSMACGETNSEQRPDEIDNTDIAG